MNYLKLILFLFLISSSKLYAQSDTLNQYDANGEKTGYWIIYLDANWKKITDSTQACSSRYAYFIKGGNLYPMASWGKKGYTLKRNGQVVECKTGNPELLDGEYKWYDNKGSLISTHVLKNGIYQSYEYYYKNGVLKGGFAYTEQCGNTLLDYCMFLCDKKGNITSKTAIPRDSNGKPINKE